jgi:hypothetical protein
MVLLHARNATLRLGGKTSVITALKLLILKFFLAKSFVHVCALFSFVTYAPPLSLLLSMRGRDRRDVASNLLILKFFLV